MTLKRILLIPLLLIFGATAISACGSDSGSESGKLEVTDVWARTSPPGQTTSAIYATIKGGDEADRLVKATVPADIAGKAEIHETTTAGDQMDKSGEDHESGDPAKSDDMSGSEMEGDHDGSGQTGTTSGHGNMSMKQVHSVEIPAGEEVDLEPGGLHIMLFDLADPLKADQTFPVVLTFGKAGEIKVDATVREE
ncbi:MAG: copper chaperone PCu(A)C [Solirubrobacterales bacterium]|nr:copper chaperone PCu(A)C [Solirubrobacterales bacterium]